MTGAGSFTAKAAIGAISTTASGDQATYVFLTDAVTNCDDVSSQAKVPYEQYIAVAAVLGSPPAQSVFLKGTPDGGYEAGDGGVHSTGFDMTISRPNGTFNLTTGFIQFDESDAAHVKGSFSGSFDGVTHTEGTFNTKLCPNFHPL